MNKCLENFQYLHTCVLINWHLVNSKYMCDYIFMYVCVWPQMDISSKISPKRVYWFQKLKLFHETRLMVALIGFFYDRTSQFFIISRAAQYYSLTEFNISFWKCCWWVLLPGRFIIYSYCKKKDLFKNFPSCRVQCPKKIEI